MKRNEIAAMTANEIDEEAKSLLTNDLKFPEPVSDSIIRYMRASNLLADGIDSGLINNQD